MRKHISCVSDAAEQVHANSAILPKVPTVSVTAICNAGYAIRQGMRPAEPITQVTARPSDATEADTCPTALSALPVTEKEDIPAMYATVRECLNVNADNSEYPASAISATELDGDSSILREYAITPHRSILPTGPP